MTDCVSSNGISDDTESNNFITESYSRDKNLATSKYNAEANVGRNKNVCEE
jgi:hypothetical protein